MLIFRLSALALLSASAFAQTSPQSPSAPGQTCVLTGHVVNAITGEPVKKATVRLIRQRQNAQAGIMFGSEPDGMNSYAGSSESDGSFRFENIPPGDYILTGQRSTFILSQYGAKGPMLRGKTITVAPGQTAIDITLTLYPEAVITGKVVDEDGDPIPDVMVQAMRQSWSRGKRQYVPRGNASTNDLGQYRIYDLAPGKYCVRAVYHHNHMSLGDLPAIPGKPQIQPVTTFSPDALTLESAGQIDVKAGQDATGIDIRMRSGEAYHVRGRLAAAVSQQEDSRRVLVFIFSNDDEMFWSMDNQAPLKKDGSFDISGVVPGSYLVAASQMGAGPMRTLARQTIEVRAGDLNNVVLVPVTPGSLQGVINVEGTPASSPVNVSSLHPRLNSANPGPFMSAPKETTNDDGTFTIDDIAPGKYTISVNTPPGTYLKSVRLNRQDVLGKELDLTQATSGQLEITVRYGTAEVDGTLDAGENGAAAGPSATAPSGYTAVLIPEVLNADGSGMHLADVAQNGSFTIKNVPPGLYRVYAFEGLQNTGALQDPDVMKLLESKGVEIDIKENDKKQVQVKPISADDLQQMFAELGIEDVQ